MIMRKAPSKRRIVIEIMAVAIVLLLGVIFEPHIDGLTFVNVIRFLMTAMLLGLLVFVWRYSLQPWREYAGGRALMTLASTLLTVMTVVVSGWLLGDYPGREAVWIVAFGLAAWAVWRLTVTLVQSQRRGLAEYRESKR